MLLGAMGAGSTVELVHAALAFNLTDSVRMQVRIRGAQKSSLQLFGRTPGKRALMSVYKRNNTNVIEERVSRLRDRWTDSPANFRCPCGLHRTQGPSSEAVQATGSGGVQPGSGCR